MLLKEVQSLIVKEIQLELRNRYSLNGVLLYVLSTIFVCYLSFHEIIDPATWNTLFWIITLFTSVNAISKSFAGETRGRLLYLYTLASPSSVILSKLIYNVVLMVIVTSVTLLFYSLLLGNTPLEGANLGMYFTALILGCTGFSAIFTLIAAIASKTNNNLGIMAILGFPLILPLLMTLINLSALAIRGLPWSYGLTDVLVLGGINVLVATLSYLLFPYLWRE